MKPFQWKKEEDGSTFEELLRRLIIIEVEKETGTAFGKVNMMVDK